MVIKKNNSLQKCTNKVKTVNDWIDYLVKDCQC